jgi:hypothetical protein
MDGTQPVATLYQLQKLFSFKLYEMIIAFGKLQRISDEAVVDNFKALPRISLRGNEENHGISVRTEIQTRHFMNTSLDRYHFCQFAR